MMSGPGPFPFLRQNPLRHHAVDRGKSVDDLQDVDRCQKSPIVMTYSMSALRSPNAGIFSMTALQSPIGMTYTVTVL